MWYVAKGVERLRQWAGDRKIVWNCIECTRISNPDRKPTPHEVRCEVWMSLIRGSRGLIYFVHQFKPTFLEAALLDDPELLEAVTKLNRQITKFAPILNSPPANDVVAVDSKNPNVPVELTVRQHDGATWIFAVAMRDSSTTAEFTLKNVAPANSVEVIDEGRSLPIREGTFKDHFEGWDVHLYRVRKSEP